MYWDGGATGVWDSSTPNWDRTPGNDADANVAYNNGDSVIFAYDTELTVLATGMAPASIVLESGVDVGITADSFSLASVSMADDATLSLKGGVYTIGESLGAENAKGTVIFYGTDIDTTSGITDIWSDVNILSDVTYTAARAGGSYDTAGVTKLHSALSIGEGKTLTLDGDGRFIVEAGATINLADGATMERTAAGAYWFKGELNVEEGASAVFSTVDDIHFNYQNDGTESASINLGADSKLTLTATSIQQWGNNNASINLGARSELAVTNALSLARTSLNMADGAALSVGANSSVGGVTLAGSGKFAASAIGVTLTASSLSFTAGSTLTVDTTTLSITDGVTQGEGSRVLGTATEHKTTTIIPTNGGVLDDRGSFYAVGGTLNIGDDDATNGGTVYVKGLALMGNGADYTSTLNVKSGNTFVITGTANTGTAEATVGGKNYGDFQITAYDNASQYNRNQNTVINVEGTLTANSRFSVAGGTGTFNVRNGGTVNMLDGTAEGGANTAIIYNVDNGGRVNIASYESGRASDGDNNVTLKLADGATVGGIADSSRGEEIYMLQKVEVGGTATIDTDAATYDTTSFVVTETDNGSDMVFTRDITSKQGTDDAVLKVAGHGTAHVAGTATLTGGVQVEADATLAVSGATVATNPVNSSVNALATLSAADGTAAATMDGAVRISHTDSSANIVGTGDEKAIMHNSLVTIAQGASLTVENMLISDSSRITGAATFAAREAAVTSAALNNTTIALGTTNTTIGQMETLTLSSLQVMNPSAIDASLTLSGVYNVLTVNSVALSNLLVQSGSNFVVDFSNIFAGHDLTDIDLVYLDFSGVDYEEASATTITGTLGDEQLTAYYQTAQDIGVATPNVGTYFDVRYIPEPSTTTLSLLALAALAARRRRK